MTDNIPKEITIDDDWHSITSSELSEAMPKLEASRALDTLTITHHKHLPTVKGVAHKITSYVSVTFKTVAFEHIHIILKMIMVELEKIKKISGEEKKEICKLIMIYILDVFGIPHTVSYYSVELIESLIELIYHHEIKKRKKKCCC